MFINIRIAQEKLMIIQHSARNEDPDSDPLGSALFS